MSTEDENKHVIARLFDALRVGDVSRLDELMVPDYVQHNPQAGNGRDAVKAFFAKAGPIEVDIHRLIAEGEFVVVHSHMRTWNMAAVDLYRIVEGLIVEHWDVHQQVPESTTSGNDMFSQVTK